MTKVERIGIACLLCLALAMFFFPLLTIQMPMGGEESVSGYDVFSEVNQLRHEFGGNTRPSFFPGNSPGGTSPSETLNAMPLTLRYAWFMPLFILGALACASVALAGTFASRKVVKVFGALGTLLGILAVLHVYLLGSALRAWITESMSGAAGPTDNPFAKLAQGMAAMIASSFDIRAGAGLWVLTVCLLIAAVLAWTGVLSRDRNVAQ